MISSTSNVGASFTFREWLVGCALSNPNIIPEGTSPDIAAAKAWAFADAVIKFYTPPRRSKTEDQFPTNEPPTTPASPSALDIKAASSPPRAIKSNIGSSYSFVNTEILNKK